MMVVEAIKTMRVSAKGLRDLFLFLGGAALMTYEVLGVPEPRIAVLGIAAAMLGLPGSLGMDRLLSRSVEPPSPPPAATPPPSKGESPP